MDGKTERKLKVRQHTPVSELWWLKGTPNTYNWGPALSWGGDRPWRGASPRGVQVGGHCSYRAGEKVTESVRGPKGPLCLGHRETEVRKRKREPHFSGCRLERDGGQEAGRGAYRDREAGVGDQDGNQELRWGGQKPGQAGVRTWRAGGYRGRLWGEGGSEIGFRPGGRAMRVGRPGGLGGRRRSQGGAAVSREPRLRQGPRGAAGATRGGSARARSGARGSKLT